MEGEITVAGVGCCLVDRLYTNISFNTTCFSQWLSVKKGDGGLEPGKLVFREEFEKFSGCELDEVVREITGGKASDKINIGGPCIVALIHAAQMLEGTGAKCGFYGFGGNDSDGNFLLSSLGKTSVNTDNYHLIAGVTPSTIVLSDPDFDNGHGERIFINSIGAAWDYKPEKLSSDFYSSNIVVFGGTALVPQIHDNLTELLEKTSGAGCITVVNTVYDFRNEKASPGKKWPLGRSDDSYRHVDLLMTDCEEALRLSGKSDPDDAILFFAEKGTGSVVITNGSKNIRFWSSGKRFSKAGISQLPVSAEIMTELKKGHSGDTTGCGDNFAGGMIASIVMQIKEDAVILDLKEACIQGIVSGGYACFYIGGTFFENYPGEKKSLIRPYYEKYKQRNDGR